MASNVGTRRAFAAVALGSSLLAVTAGAAPSACDDEVAGNRVIAVSARRLAPIAGAPVSELRAWTIQGGVRVAVPFQIDQCDPDGRVELGGTHDPDRLDSDGVALFRIADAGERDRDPKETGVEIELALPEGAGTRFLYLGRLGAQGPMSDRDDVDYDSARDRVHAERYALGFGQPQADYFSLADGKGNEHGNLLDRLKARVAARFLWGLISFRRNEEQIGEEVMGFRDGPIRVVRRARLHVEIGWGIPSPEIIADDYFYADHAEGPIYVSLPFPLAYVFGDLDVRIYLDFRDLDGFEVVSQNLPPGALRVGSPSAEDGAEAPGSWFLLRGGDQSMLHRLRFGPTLGGLDSFIYYADAPNQPDPPEAVPGSRPAVGYHLINWSSVGRGRHEIWMDTYVLSGEDLGDPVAAVARLSRLPEIRVRPLGGEPS